MTRRVLPLLLAFGLGLLVARWAFSGESQVRAARSSAICVGTGCYNVKRYYDNAYVCSFKYTCPDPCLNPSAIPCSSWVCGQIGTAYYVEEIVTCYEPTPTPPPPPVLNLEVLCDAWGTGGWCRANGRLRATGQDPAGGTVTVSGTLGDPAGTPVQCSGSGTCTATVPLPEGQGTAQVTATSQYGQAQGSQAWKYDPTPPQMTYSLNPASPDGQNGWYVTAPVVTVQGADATSGIAALRVSPDGGATWHASPWTVPDGQYTLLVQAVDGAGNITQAQVPVKVDTTAPQVQYHIPPATGQDGWHVAPVTVQVSGQDATSGVALAQVAVNGGPWQDGGATLAADGVYTLRFRAVDAAGNQAQAGPVEVKVDVTPPRLTWGSGWDGALSCAPTLTGRVEDGAGSGVAGAAISWDGGQTWQALPLTPTATGGGPTAWLWQVRPDLRGWADGTYEVQVKVWDRAGLQATYRKTFTVAQPKPHIVVRPLGTGARWYFWDLLTFEVQTTCLPIHRMRIVVEGPDRNRTVTWDTSTWEAPSADGGRPVVYSVTWRWDTAWDNGRFAPPGEYPVRFEAWDAWGRKYMEFGTLVVPVMGGPTPTPAPLPSPTATPTARPSPTVAGSGLPTTDRRRPTIVPPTPLATPSPAAFSGRPTAPIATATPLPTATPVPRHTGLVGRAPTWAKTVAVGTLFAGVFLAWLALAREVARRRWTTARRVGPGELKRLVPPWLRRPRRQPKPSHDHVSDVAERAAKEQEEMVLHFAEQGEPGMDLAEWKRYDNEQLARYERIRQADLAFDAEVGGPEPPPPPSEGTPEYHEWEERYAHLKPDVQAEAARVQSEAIRNQILLPSQIKMRLPTVQYAYPYHGPWYDLEHGEYREHQPPSSSPLLTAVPTPTPTPPLVYHPTPPSLISTPTITPVPSATPIPPSHTPQTPVPRPAPTPEEAFSSSPPSLPSTSQEVAGIRIEWSAGIGAIGIDLNFDVVYFNQSKEIAVFVSPPLAQTGFTGGSSLSGGVLWGQGASSEEYAGTAFGQGIHTPPFVISVGETLIPVPGIEFERAWSSSAVLCYFGIASGLEMGVYEEPSYAIRLLHFHLP